MGLDAGGGRVSGMASGPPKARTAVVTGGGSGMGRSICEHLARQGCQVAVLDLDADAADATADALRGAGSTAMAQRVDVADRSAVDAAFAAVRAELGPVEILVTSAAISGFVPFEAITLEDWTRTLTVNLTGTFNCLQAAIADMVAAGWGRIVTISSSSAQSGAPNMAHYVASKGGVIALTKALAVELAREGITVNTIPPSLVDTPMVAQAAAKGDFPGVEVVGPMVPVGRAGTPADVAEACSFLCSEAASYITGQVIGVNGGMYI
jgi:NAD(P)-dependent dehydrogenase (short-subunit alcohol dehydrogenase family)